MVDITCEMQYLRSQTEDHVKQYAQFFTPPEIADFMVSWVLDINPSNVLEPAFGLGIFSRLVLQSQHNANVYIKGFEIDSEIYSQAIRIFDDHPNVQIVNDDYMSSDWNSKYEAIVCNPPYIRFHDYDNLGIIQDVETKSGYRFRLTSNIYTMFLIKSIIQLTAGGRASYIVPTEFMNSDYGIAIKRFLIESNVLRYILVIDSSYMAFTRVLTTSTILLMQNDSTTDAVAMKSVYDTNDLSRYLAMIKEGNISSDFNYYKNSELNPSVKWSQYYNPSKVRKKTSNLIPFNQYANVKRGIATGDNEYFTFSKMKAFEFGIPEEFLVPCITKAQHVTTQVFTKNDFELLVENDKRTYLLDASKGSNKNVADYLALGLSKGVHLKYLTSKRKPWYSIENRKPSDLWIGVFNRANHRFIINKAHVRNLTTFHCVYLNNIPKEDKILFMAYLLSDVSIDMLVSHEREYGNGLKKLEPNDINHSLIPDINRLCNDLKRMIIGQFHRFMESAREGDVDESILASITDILYSAFELHS